MSARPVTVLRKEGRLEEALALAVSRMTAPDRDEWDVRDYAWCLIALIKAAVGAGRPETAAEHGRALAALEPPEGDDVLAQGRSRALALLADGGAEVAQARAHGKAGRHREAIAIYAALARRRPLDTEEATGFAWELYRATKALVGMGSAEELPPPAVAEAKRHLNAYMGLSVERPSVLHSLMLRFADRLAGGGQLRMLPFVRLWGLDHLRDEDFAPYKAPDGKTLPSLAEKVLGKAAKEAAATGDRGACEALLPRLDALARRVPDGLWVDLNRIKLLSALGRREEALDLALGFVRRKGREYWAWDFLADLQDDPVRRLACWCKALTCSDDDAFVGPVRLKLAGALAEAGHQPEAKGEVERVLAHKAREGHRVPEAAQALMCSGWYASTTAAQPSKAFYARFASAADDLLFADHPWVDACLGDTVTIEGREGKPLRRLYLRSASLPEEVAVPVSIVRIKGAGVGQPVRVKGDRDAESGRFVLHAIDVRPDGAAFDVFPETIGVIEGIDARQETLRVSAGRDTQSVVPLGGYEGPLEVGAPVSLKLAIRRSQGGAKGRVLSVDRTDQKWGPQVCRPFRSAVRVTGSGLGFADDRTFVPPDLVAANELEDGDWITGLAVPSFDKKQEKWGWKAIKASPIHESARLA